MERREVLRQQRERIMSRLNDEQGDRTKLLIALMDIDDEMEEMGHTPKSQLPPMPSRRRIRRELLA